MATHPEPRVKGSALAAWIAWYARQHGAPSLMAIAEAIPESARGFVDPESETLGVIPTEWYPAEAVGALLDGLTAGLTVVERTALIRDSTRASVDEGVRGIFKLAFELLATPERYAKHIQRFWNQLHDTGARRVEIVGPGEAHSFIEDWPGHHPLLCEVTMETMAAIFRKMGLEDVEVLRVECVGAGDARCKAVLRWRS